MILEKDACFVKFVGQNLSYCGDSKQGCTNFFADGPIS